MNLERITKMDYSGLSEEITLDEERQDVKEAVREAVEEKDAEKAEIIENGFTIWRVSWSEKSESVQVHYFKPIGTFEYSHEDGNIGDYTE